MADPGELRKLASWYRKFAERAGNPVIWDCRLRMAEDLDEEAGHLERVQATAPGRHQLRLPRCPQAQTRERQNGIGTNLARTPVQR